jgi:hypothetical protein
MRWVNLVARTTPHFKPVVFYGYTIILDCMDALTDRRFFHRDAIDFSSRFTKFSELDALIRDSLHQRLHRGLPSSVQWPYPWNIDSRKAREHEFP